MIIRDLVKLANHLDKIGYPKEADHLDEIVMYAASIPQAGNTGPSGHLSTDFNTLSHGFERLQTRRRSMRQAKSYRAQIITVVDQWLRDFAFGFKANSSSEQWTLAKESFAKLESLKNSLVEEQTTTTPVALPHWVLKNEIERCEKKGKVYDVEAQTCNCPEGFTENAQGGCDEDVGAEELTGDTDAGGAP